MVRFLPLWLGQMISALGSGLTAFGLGVWVYETTGSVSQFALITFSSVLPGILLAPIAGTLVDRFDRRAVLAVSNLGSAATVTGILVLLATDSFQTWHLYFLLGAQSLFQALHLPGFLALTAALVPATQVGRASGMVELGDAMARIVAPSIAGVLLARLGCWWPRRQGGSQSDREQRAVCWARRARVGSSCAPSQGCRPFWGSSRPSTWLAASSRCSSLRWC
jgi:MFS transporter, DHA3 family, macrolide efflux protein